jgi:hypothetical protein
MQTGRDAALRRPDVAADLFSAERLDNDTAPLALDKLLRDVPSSVWLPLAQFCGPHK